MLKIFSLTVFTVLAFAVIAVPAQVTAEYPFANVGYGAKGRPPIVVEGVLTEYSAII
jgi:hypothetical protein